MGGTPRRVAVAARIVLITSVLSGYLLPARASADVRPAFVAASTADLPDTAPGDGACDTNGATGDDGSDCTLRAAVMESNALDGPDEIELVASVYHLTIANGTEADGYEDERGDLDITSAVTIAGVHRASSVVDGGNRFELTGGPDCDDHAGLDDRIFDVSPGGTAVFSRVGIEGGDATRLPVAGNGGGVRNAGDLQLLEIGIGARRTALGCYSNRAAVGGDVFTSGRLFVLDTHLSRGLATAGGGLALADGGRVHVNHARIGGRAEHGFFHPAHPRPWGHNAALCAGAGIYNAATSALLKIHRRTTIYGNNVSNTEAASCPIAGAGGGIYNQGPLVMHDVWVGANSASDGGGIANEPVAARSRPTVRLASIRLLENKVTGDGGGLSNVGGSVEVKSVSARGNKAANGGGVSNESTCTSRGEITGRGFGASDNRARGLSTIPAPGLGGGLFNHSLPDGCPDPALQPKIEVEFFGAGRNRAGSPGVTAGLGAGVYNGGRLVVALGGAIYNNHAIDGNTEDGKGGALYNDGGPAQAATVELTEVQLGQQYDGNFDGSNTAALGGALYNAAARQPNEIELDKSSVIYNDATTGAGIYNDGGKVTVSNSTIARNTAAGDGGGLFVTGNSPVEGTTRLENTTVALNSSVGSGDGIAQSGDHVASLHATIVAQNPQAKPSGVDANCAGTVMSDDYNLDDDGSCHLAEPNDLSNVADAGVGEPIVDDPFDTYASFLTRTSAAIDHGPVTGCPATDQQEVARPLDGDRDGTPRCDIGAWERDPYDTDGDRINDVDDHCDTQPGPWFYNGCPAESLDHGPDGDGSTPSPSPSSSSVPPPSGGGGGGGGGAPPDADHDGKEDSKDNCRDISNADQLDTDADGSGDACDGDDDNDGVLDGADNCPSSNSDQSDLDSDGHGDVCDPDDDNDGVADGSDNCPAVANADQADADGDGAGSACDDEGGEPAIYETSATVRFDGGKFHGSLGVLPSTTTLLPDKATASPADPCGASRHVGLYRIRNGAAHWVTRGLTNARYRFHIYRPEARGRFYVRVEEMVTDAGTCSAAQSRTITVR